MLPIERVTASGALLALAICAPASAAGGVIEPVPFTRVRLEGGLLGERIETNRRVTIPYAFEQCERTGRIANFAVAGGLAEGSFRGECYDDSDVFKLVEGASYALATRPDEELARRLDAVVNDIAAAQEADGYLYTLRTIEGEDVSRPAAGAARWARVDSSHELYNAGHLYEAAVAHWRSTGERALLEVASKNAALVAEVFGPGEGQRRDPPGHQEIELGLIGLHRATGETRWLDLARFFLEARGRSEGRRSTGEYGQDHLPVREQREAVGHAVRAGYMYAAMAELEALSGAGRYRAALDALWSDVVGRKMYVTGGVGAERAGEGFGRPFELPNESAYAETCAAIAQVLWNQRMFLLEPDARYIDVLERVLYNGLLSGVSIEGDRFFYPNPLAFDGVTRFNHGERGRAPWFRCSCCPVNIARSVPALPGLVYARAQARGTDRAVLWVNLYARGEARIDLAGRELGLAQETDYPWSSEVALAVGLDAPLAFELRLRVPGWSRGVALPGDLYRFLDSPGAPPSLHVNGTTVPLELERGYARITRTWRDGDRVELSLPMTVRRVVADERVEAARGRVALQRGPLVYCFEAADCEGSVGDVFLSDDARIELAREGTEGPISLELDAERVELGGERAQSPARVRAIPYFLWGHRGPGEMAVWIPRGPALARPPAPPPFAARATPSASHVWRGDTLDALNDGREPESSRDTSLPRFTWWDRLGGREWVQLEFPSPVRLAGCALYWFDDTGAGRCRPPRAWRLLAREQGEWRRVRSIDSFAVELDRFNAVAFAPTLETDALRVEVELREGSSAGVLEWRVTPAE